jgi:hypothetical protein
MPCDVPNPRESLVAALFRDFKISHLDAGDCEVWDLELDINGLVHNGILIVSANGRQAKVASAQELLLARKLFYRPDHAVCVGIVLNLHVCTQQVTGEQTTT